MTSDPLRNAQRLFISSYSILPWFSIALEEDFLLHSGCTSQRPENFISIKNALLCVCVCVYINVCTLHIRALVAYTCIDISESTVIQLTSHSNGSCPLCSVWAHRCFPSVLNWKLAFAVQVKVAWTRFPPTGQPAALLCQRWSHVTVRDIYCGGDGRGWGGVKGTLGSPSNIRFHSRPPPPFLKTSPHTMHHMKSLLSVGNGPREALLLPPLCCYSRWTTPAFDNSRSLALRLAWESGVA